MGSARSSESTIGAVNRARAMVESGNVSGDTNAFLSNVESVAGQLFDQKEPISGTFNVRGVAESIRLKKKELWHDDKAALQEITGISAIWMGAFPESNPENLDALIPTLPNVLRAVFGLNN